MVNMSKQLNELLNDLKDWINCPLDEIERYGIWELEVNQSKELLDYINQLQQDNKQLKILVGSLQLGVTLNEKQEKLLNSIMFGSGKYE